MTPQQEQHQIDFRIKQLEQRIADDMNELIKLKRGGEVSLKFRLVLVEESMK